MKRNTKLKQLPSNLMFRLWRFFPRKFSLKISIILNRFNWKLDQDLFSFCVDAFSLNELHRCEMWNSAEHIYNNNRIKEIGLDWLKREENKKKNRALYPWRSITWLLTKDKILIDWYEAKNQFLVNCLHLWFVFFLFVLEFQLRTISRLMKLSHSHCFQFLKFSIRKLTHFFSLFSNKFESQWIKICIYCFGLFRFASVCVVLLIAFLSSPFLNCLI